MTIAEIYAKYRIMPNLQQHMFRVAGVAELIADQLLHPTVELDQPFTPQDCKDVVTAALLHDMGNIVKFKLDYFPEFLQPEGLTYWQVVQQEFWDVYGKNAHQATLSILKELEVSERVTELVNAVSFNKAKRNLDSDDFACKVCAYADMRVAPHGVVSLEERLADGRKRYQPEDKKDTFSYVMAAYLRKLEKQLFAVVSLVPTEIDDIKVSKLFSTYPDWEV